jgi:molecular chaperone DnaK
MLQRLNSLADDDITDEKFQIDEQKRKMAYAIDAAGKEQRIRTLKEEYFYWKESTRHYVEESNNETAKRKLAHLEASENEFLNGSESSIKRKIEELRQISWDGKKKNLEYLIGVYFFYYEKDDSEYKDVKKIKQLREKGDAAIERRSAEELLNVIYLMYDLWLHKEFDEPLKGTGLS